MKCARSKAPHPDGRARRARPQGRGDGAGRIRREITAVIFVADFSCSHWSDWRWIASGSGALLRQRAMFRQLGDQRASHDRADDGNLPDRVFFACGGVSIIDLGLCDSFDKIWRCSTQRSRLWHHNPATGFYGATTLLSRGRPIGRCDYHGILQRRPSSCARRMHIEQKANRWWPGWRATLVPLPRDVLISEAKSRSYDGLWLREPTQFLHNALPRAHAYLSRFPAPPQVG